MFFSHVYIVIGNYIMPSPIMPFNERTTRRKTYYYLCSLCMTVTKMLATAHQAASLDCDDIHGESSSLPSATTTWDAVRCLSTRHFTTFLSKQAPPCSNPTTKLILDFKAEAPPIWKRPQAIQRILGPKPTPALSTTQSTEINYLAGLIYKWYHYYRKVDGEKFIPSQLIM